MIKVVIIGLGYVGLPIAIAFAKKYETYGFDIDTEKIEKYKEGIDITNEVGNEELKNTKLKFTTDSRKIKEANYIIITVPTPIDNKNNPDLSFIKKATELVGKNLSKGSTIIYESTVYPGTTEEICVPLLEGASNMKFNKDFFVGYSPERINPGDNEHKFENINKIVSGSNEYVTDDIAKLYQKCLNSKIKKVSSIKVAEASKIIENTQRDINIAFINEISKIFHLMNIDTKEVLDAASTKWNFLNFKPGLVGGHCIGVDPYYLSYKAQELNFNPQVILSGRKINDSMGEYVAENIKKILNENKIKPNEAKILIKGLTFKENVPDIRNSKVIDIIKILKNENIKLYFEDYKVDNKELKNMYQLSLSKKVPKVDVVVFAVKHTDYYKLTIDDLDKYYEDNNMNKIIFDLHAIFNKDELIKRGYKVWRL